MYLEYFGLLEAPFSIAPDPRYLYMSERHREALAHLLYGLNSDGAFILLSGDVGTGKTTVSRCLLEQVPEKTQLAMVLNPKLNSIELLQVICDELGIEYSPQAINTKILVDQINQHLLKNHAEGMRTVVLVEEAQNLDLDVLEQLRLLTNLETNERKLLQVILLGQPELLEILDRDELSQLSQRITARFHLGPLSEMEVKAYIGHRLAVAGCRRTLFAAGTIRQIYKYSGGVPRLINVICDRALLGCFVQNRELIDKKIIRSSAIEVLGANRAGKMNSVSRGIWRNGFLPTVSVLVLLVLTIGWFVYGSKIDWSGLNNEPMAKNPAQDADLSTEAVNEVAGPGMLVSQQKQTDDVSLPSEKAGAIQWPVNNLRLRGNLLAYQALFAEWQIEYDISEQSTPCFFAQTRGLSCLHEVLDLQGLMKLNRPAILTLYDDVNQPQYVTLSRLDSDDASIVLAGQQQNVELKQLLFYWKGEVSLLWKNPKGYQTLIRPGSEGEQVVWLSEMMNRIEATPGRRSSSYYDYELVRRVKQFQLSQGLEDDGVVGVKTLIHINQALGLLAPQLRVSPASSVENNS